ncbi:MAG: Spy/CpxP family protein refolding chaperone [Deferribacterales bacterium]
MRNNTLKAILILSAALNLSLITGIGIYSFSGNKAFSCAHSGGGYVFEKLNLRDEQKKKITGLAEDFHSRLDRMSGEIAESNKKLIREIVSSEYPDGVTDGLIGDISGRQREIQELIVRHLFEIKAEMDSDQREQFFRLIEDAFPSGRGVY